MSKKVQKTLTGAMAAMMATGMVATPVSAQTTDKDALYKAAYVATNKAMTDKTQVSINEAREAIKALPADMDWAIGEFSKQVDKVQHPILVDIVQAINKAEKETVQANINAAKKTIPAELLVEWKSSYSSAIDKIQQGLQKKVIDSVEKAEKEKSQKNIDAARIVVNDVLTAEDQGIKDWAKIYSDRLDAIKLYDLKFVDVTAFSKYNLAVKFEALTETKTKVVLEVIDNNGEKVEVKESGKLLEGRTTNTFEFKNIRSEVPEGVWTINGVEVDFTEKTLLEKAKNAKYAEAELIALQKDGYISGLAKDEKDEKKVAADNLKKYQEEIKKIEKVEVVTSEKIQEVIDKVNENLAIAKEEEDAVKEIKDAFAKASTSQIVALLNTQGIERVNEEWINEENEDDYKEAIEDEKVNTIKLIQEKIDGINLIKANKVLETAKDSVNSEVIDEAIILINDFVNPETKTKVSEDKELVKKDEMLAKLEIANAMSNLVVCDNTTALKKNAKEVSEVVKQYNDNFGKELKAEIAYDYDTVVNESNALEYVNKLDEAKIDVTKEDASYSVANFKTLIQTVNTAQKDAALKAVGKAFAEAKFLEKDGKATSDYTEETEAAIMKAFATLQEKTAKEVQVKDADGTAGKEFNKFDASVVVKANLETYKIKEKIIINNEKVVTPTINELMEYIKTENKTIEDNAKTTKVTEAIKKIAAAKDANNEEELVAALSNKDLGLKNVVAANAKQYLASENIKTLTKADEIDKALKEINVTVAVSTAKTTAEMHTAVTDFAVQHTLTHLIQELDDAKRQDIAEELLAIKNDKTAGPLNSVEDIKTNIAIAEAKANEKIDALNIAITAGEKLTIGEAINAIAPAFEKTSIGKIETFVNQYHINENNKLKIATDTKTEYIKGFTNYTQVRALAK